MSTYFSFLPKIQYNLYNVDTIESKTVVDIFVRQKLREDIKEESITFYEYLIPEGERADVLAYNYYGGVEYTWLIWFANNIVDPYLEWPMTQQDFDRDIVRKYGSAIQAKELIYQYQQIVRNHSKYHDAYNIVIDETTYNSLPEDERRIVSYFDHEVALNDAKRFIRLIDVTYASAIYKEAQRKFVL